METGVSPGAVARYAWSCRLRTTRLYDLRRHPSAGGQSSKSSIHERGSLKGPLTARVARPGGGDSMSHTLLHVEVTFPNCGLQ